MKLQNSIFIYQEIKCLRKIIAYRTESFFSDDSGKDASSMPEMQNVPSDRGSYADFILEHRLEFPDRLALVLAFAPYVSPKELDVLGKINFSTGNRFADCGGIKYDDFEGYIPTFSTLLFLLSGDNTVQALEYVKYFHRSPLFTEKYLLLTPERNLPEIAYPLRPSSELISSLLYETDYLPSYSERFPARKLETSREWSDLVLNETTMKQIDEIRLWIEYGDRIMKDWKLERVLKPGYKAMFYGPSGTGKTFAATLLGKYTGKEVYCVDLSMISSKYIGETEKNLSEVFDVAERHDWILFFDEGDALFGKRTQVKDSHDRYANQEVSYLLQRIENFPGLIILSTNFRTNIDDAFSRRFQNVVKFSLPSEDERLRLWEMSFSSQTCFDEQVDLVGISREYEVTGATILNVVRYCSLMAMQRKSNVITNEDILEGIRREFRKEGKLL